MNLADSNNDRAAVGPEPMEVEDDYQEPDYVRGRQLNNIFKHIFTYKVFNAENT